MEKACMISTRYNGGAVEDYQSPAHDSSSESLYRSPAKNVASRTPANIPYSRAREDLAMSTKETLLLSVFASVIYSTTVAKSAAKVETSIRKPEPGQSQCSEAVVGYRDIAEWNQNTD